MIGVTAEAKALEVSAVVADDVPQRAWGDAARLRQVLVNLAGNAVKFTQNGEVAVSVTRGEGTLEFSVRDTGIGIDPAKREAIFDPFTQADRRFGGTGLGLAIVARLVEAMGGTIAVESKPGRGSTFRFTVPTQFDDLPASAAQSVLVVDDNLVNQEFAAETLRRLGHRVEVASSGEEAVEIAARNSFDTVLMDLQMPGIDGYETTRRLRAMENGKRTRIVALTAHGSAEDRERCFAAGMDEVMVKPVQREKLTASLGRESALRVRVRDAFAAQTPRLMSAMRDAIARGDAVALARDAHTMKGALSNFAVQEGVDAAALLEETANANELGNAAVVFSRLENAVREVEKTL
jgi:CheY-like chemotaxis protein/anti-sigma regulatory factor (Ser/Thr protein kinase)